MRYDGAELTRNEVAPGPPHPHRRRPRRHEQPAPALLAAGVRNGRAPRHRRIGWGGWPELLADVDRPYDDPRALNVRHGGAEGIFGTVSASLLALGPDRLKFEFCPGPPDRTEWETVL